MCQRCILDSVMRDNESPVGSADGDDYEIVREISRGGDGTVYLCHEKRLDRQVAVKLIQSLRKADTVSELRFQTEVAAIASLDHPYIVPIYASGEMDGRPFYSMKYYSGGSLANRMEAFSSAKSAAGLMAKLARAIHHAHERGILHRDLKPSNILLENGDEPIISDFGLAKRYEEDLSLTLTGSVMGTPAYMSPEQAVGNHAQVTTTSDIFSLGAIMFQLLTGTQAFEGETSHAVLRNVIESDVQFPRDRSHAIDEDLETICLKCLRKDPEKRYVSALSLAEDLERWQRGEPVEARPITGSERALRWVKRHPFPFATLAIAVVSLIGGAITSFSLWRHSEKANVLAFQLRETAEENAYYLSVSNALISRERFDFGEARRLLDSAPRNLRGFEWRLVNGLTKGDYEWSVPIGKSKPLHLVQDRAGNRILVLMADRKFYAVDPETGKRTLAGELPDTPGGSPTNIRHPGILQFAFAPDGEHYAFVDGDRLLIVHVASGEIVHDGKCKAATNLVWLNSHRLVHTQGSFYGTHRRDKTFFTTAWSVDLVQGKEKALPDAGWRGPLSLSPDGKYVAVGHDTWEMWVQPFAENFTEPPLHRFPARQAQGNQVCFSPDGQLLATFHGSTIQIFDLATDTLMAKLTWPSKALIAYSNDSKALLITGREPWFALWHFPQALLDMNMAEAQEPYLPPSSLLARTSKDGHIRFFLGHLGPVTASLILPGDQGVLTIGSDHTMKKWRLVSKNERPNNLCDALATGHGSRHPSASHNGDYVLYRHAENYPERWHRPTGRFVALPESHEGLVVFNDGRVLSRDTENKDIVCWADREGSEQLEELWRRPGETNNDYLGAWFVHSATSLDERFAAVLHPGRVLTVDVEEKLGRTVPNQIMVYGSTPGQSTSISPDGALAAVTGFIGAQTRIYDGANPGQNIRQVIPVSPYTSKDSACVFSRDGSRLFAGNNDGWIRVFDVETLEEIPGESWQAHSSEITALAISQRGDILASAGGENLILWSVVKQPDQPRRRRLRLNVGAVPRNWIQFAAKDTLLLHSGPERPIEVWEAP